jgi:hypothetical protein
MKAKLAAALVFASLGCIHASAQALSGTSLTVNGDSTLKGPNPYIDIRSYGASAVTPAAVPSALATISLTNPTTVNLNSASTFQNGDGVDIIGAGASVSMTTPGAPTVTPSQPVAP